MSSKGEICMFKAKILLCNKMLLNFLTHVSTQYKVSLRNANAIGFVIEWFNNISALRPS